MTEPDLLERMALSDEQFRDLYRSLAEAYHPREYDPAMFEKALRYPFERPTGSFVLRDAEVISLEDLPPGDRKSLVATFTADRHPILSFGGNGAPGWLEVKFAHFEDAADREALVLTGYLSGVDVGAISSPGILGYMAGTLFASPGTAVRSAVVWVTTTQATQLAWSEMTYRLGRLEDVRFEMDEADIEVEDIFAFVSRFGAFCIDGAPVALAAIPARGRTARAVTQEEILGTVAGILLGPHATAEDVVRATFEDMPALLERAEKTLWQGGQQLRSRWTPFPASGGP